MNTHIEKEARTMISEEQYLLLCSNETKKHPELNYLEQTNYYFDNRDFILTNNHRVVRIRNVDSRYELTYKAKDIGGDLEINQDLSPNQAKQYIEKGSLPLGDIYNKILSYNVNPSSLFVITSLFTKRLEVDYEDYLLVIDMNKYDDVIDYNLEIESKISLEHANEILKRYCKQYQLSYTDDYLVKSARAINLAKKKYNIKL